MKEKIKNYNNFYINSIINFSKSIETNRETKNQWIDNLSSIIYEEFEKFNIDKKQLFKTSIKAAKNILNFIEKLADLILIHKFGSFKK